MADGGPMGVGAVGAVAGPIRGILFDVDDTLVDTRSAFRVALVAAFDPWLPDVKRVADELLGIWRRDAGGHYWRYTRGELGYREQRVARVNLILEGYGRAPLDSDGYEAWSAAFDDALATAWRAWPDASVLPTLAAAGMSMGAVSNAPSSMQRTKLAAVGLAEQVPLLVGIDTLGVGKPEPRVFLEGCRLLGTEPGATMYVGDELRIDAEGAIAAGLHGIWLRRPGHEEVDPSGAERLAGGGIPVIDSLTDLAALTDVA